MNYEYCDGFTHTIKKGDTLYEISRKHNVSLALLLRANPYVDVFNLQVGDTLCIPASKNEMTPYPVDSEQNDKNMMSPESMMPMQPTPMQSTPDAMPMQPARQMPMQQTPMEQTPMQPEKVQPQNRPMESQEVSTAKWEKYVVKPGDTLQDVMKNTDGDIKAFVEKNRLSNIYMLPGVAYYIPIKK